MALDTAKATVVLNTLTAKFDKQAQAAKTYDNKEGIDAFLDKRKPEFRGK